ncbi:hypothetical protein GCM10009759_71250 [Kitasatospora saccharophila]|uniref:Uncharacterized protein n=1 Tax=Kitasatospora saccharophila TaxID=407973 RepID=A0ABP5JR02_9ACTN
MITITTTRSLAALRQRAEQAEGNLADTTRRLEKLLQQRPETGQDQPQMPADLAALRAELEIARRQAAEARASEARTRTVCDSKVEGAYLRAAQKEQTIAELRAELERTHVGAPAGPELPKRTVMTFLNLGGGLVALFARSDSDYPSADHGYLCLACGLEPTESHSRDVVRRWANSHAAECRAVPIGSAGA